MSHGSDPRLVDARGLVYDFLLAYVRPALDEDKILYGNQNQLTLPPESDEYAIYFIQDFRRRGTQIENYDADSEEWSATVTGSIRVRVDLYSADLDGARLRGLNLDNIFNTSLACEFFRDSGMMPLYSEGCADTTIVDPSNAYLRRYTVNLVFNLTFAYAATVEGFTDIPYIIPNSIHKTGTEGGADTLHIADADVLHKEV